MPQAITNQVVQFPLVVYFDVKFRFGGGSGIPTTALVYAGTTDPITYSNTSTDVLVYQ